MISYNANGHFEFRSTGNWGFSLEPGFIQKGGLKSYNHDIRVKRNYIQMPILVDLYILDKLFVSVGPEISYLINPEVNNTLNDFELSGLIGINLSITKNADIGIRYNRGLTYIQEIPRIDVHGNTMGVAKEINEYVQFIIRLKLNTGDNTRFKNKYWR